ncbi:MAG: tRNA (adenosine(37)-N6)-dimethylallyltransferase MiaA [Lachnospiraceae bacterium]|nr:tRNA (adenosine(37)-N6)-dimethylallyltransferase MiaA [Lachnospiraceae bacterium]
MKQPLIILTGPTAVGKTKLSISLAKAVGGEIISADSMQVYKHMDIGSAKIRPEEMEGVPHYLVDELEPWEEFHVVRFQEMARAAMADIYARGKVPILVGGTGFYIQAVLNDIDFTENEENTQFRSRLEQEAKELGAQVLHHRLKEVDPVSAEQIHTNNVKRVIRALEFYQLTGTPISEHNEQQKQKESPYNFAYFVLNDDRAYLYERIDVRVDQMLEEGLVEEVKALKEMGCTRDMVAMQGLGYKEILDYLDGECTLEEAVYILKRDTRHFAKRQITWFKREREVIWLDKQAYDRQDEKILEVMLGILKEKGIL